MEASKKIHERYCNFLIFCISASAWDASLEAPAAVSNWGRMQFGCLGGHPQFVSSFYLLPPSSAQNAMLYSYCFWIEGLLLPLKIDTQLLSLTLPNMSWGKAFFLKMCYFTLRDFLQKNKLFCVKSSSSWPGTHFFFFFSYSLIFVLVPNRDPPQWRIHSFYKDAQSWEVLLFGHYPCL